MFDVRGEVGFGCELVAGGCGEVALGGGDVLAGFCAPLVPVPLGELIYLAGCSLLRILESFEFTFCRIEFGAGSVGRVDVDFLSGPKPTGTFQEPSADLVAEKQHFGASRRARWFNG